MQSSKSILDSRNSLLGAASPVCWRLVGQFLACGAAFSFVAALVCGVI